MSQNNAKGGGPPTGIASGDLSGTYPNPTVAGIDGYAVPTPSGSNTVLTYNSGSLSWGAGGSGFFSNFTTQTTSYSITATGYLVFCNFGAGHTVTAPAPGSAGTFFGIKDIAGTAETYNITLAQHASEKIENVAASRILSTNFGYWTFISDGTNWWQIA